MCRTPFYRTSNKLKHQFSNNSNMFIYWWSNSNTIILASNDRTSNLKPNRAFTRFTKLLTELTQTSFYRTSNEHKLVHLLAIKLRHPIFGCERSNFEHNSTHHKTWRNLKQPEGTRSLRSTYIQAHKRLFECSNVLVY